MSPYGPPPPPGSYGNPHDQRAAEDLYRQGYDQMERDRLFQQGRLIEEAQRLENERIAHILGQNYQAFLAANAPASSPYPKFGRAPVFPPGPVPADYKTRPIPRPQPAAPTRAPYTPPARPAVTSKPVHPGVIAVIVLMVLAILGATVNAAFKRIIQVTPGRWVSRPDQR